MKTFTKTVEKPRLVIEHDSDAQSPREWGNLGYFITCDRMYFSPDIEPVIQDIIKETADEAKDTAGHMKLIKARINAETDDKVLAIFPVVKYEHGGVSYSLGTKHGFDYSNNGFYIVTKETAKVLGTKKAQFEKVIQEELETYNKWANGEVYGFTLYDEDGEIEDSTWGFYDIEDIRENLPEEFKSEKLEDYLE